MEKVFFKVSSCELSLGSGMLATSFLFLYQKYSRASDISTASVFSVGLSGEGQAAPALKMWLLQQEK